MSGTAKFKEVCRIWYLAPPIDVLDEFQYVAVTKMCDPVASKEVQRQSMVLIVRFLFTLDLDARYKPSTIPIVRTRLLIVPESTQDDQQCNIVAFQGSNIEPSLSCQLLDLFWYYERRFDQELEASS